MKEPKYKSIFASSHVKCVTSQEKDHLLSLASLNQLRNFIPDIDTNKNFDLLPISFSVATVNRINKNDDLINTKTALAIYKNFINKYIDLEHKKKVIIGVILTSGFSEFGTEKPLTEEFVKNLDTPFNITLGGVIWRMANPEIANLIEESNDPTSDDYLSISSSWELAFEDYDIVSLEKGQKNISTGKVISNPTEVEKISKLLRSNGGVGTFEDKRIYRMPTGEVCPIGIGITEKPAADVKGIATNTIPKKETEESQAALTGSPDYSFYFCPKCQETPKKYITTNQFGMVDCPNCKIASPCTEWKPSSNPGPVTGPINNNNVKKDAKAEELNNFENNISQSKNLDVKIERKQLMSLNSLKDITDENLKIATAGQIAELVQSELEKGNKVWLEEKKTLSTAKKELEDKISLANQENEKTLKTVKELNEKVEALAKEKAEREAVEKFNVRMGAIAEEYELDDEVRAIVVADVKAISSDEDFSKYEAKAKALFKPFKKGKKDDSKKSDDKSDDKKDDKDEAKAKKAKADDMEAKKKNKSEASVVEDAINNAKQDKSKITNTLDAETPTLKQKYEKAFAVENFVITSR